jgi:hypothetical protein
VLYNSNIFAFVGWVERSETQRICWVSYMLGFALRARDANVPQPNLRIKIFLIGAPILLNNNFAPIVPCGVGFLLEYLGGSY